LAGKPVTGIPVSLANTQEVAEYDNWFLRDVEKCLTKITAEKSLES
jgi:hypothetical protein